MLNIILLPPQCHILPLDTVFCICFPSSVSLLDIPSCQRLPRSRSGWVALGCVVPVVIVRPTSARSLFIWSIVVFPTNHEVLLSSFLRDLQNLEAGLPASNYSCIVGVRPGVA
jgi:hypothetical protein